MSETLFGPWRVRVLNMPEPFRVHLAGTENHVDGDYAGIQEVAAAGAQWTLDILREPGNPENPWAPVELLERRFHQEEGIVIDLVDAGNEHCHLLCIFADEDLNPKPVELPWDLSLPG